MIQQSNKYLRAETGFAKLKINPGYWAIVLVLFVLTACGGGEIQSIAVPSDETKLRVVTTTALLADFVENVGREWVDVSPLVPPGADVHSFQTTPEDSIAISRAQVIVLNGYGLDEFLEPVLDSARDDDSVWVVAAERLLPGETDPHLWQNPAFAIGYVDRIREALVAANPEHGADFGVNAGNYINELRELELEIEETLSQVKPELRHLITYHDAFGHLAERYGWEASSFVASDADEVSPKAVAEILERINQQGIPAIFVSPQLSSDVVRRTAEDSGIAVGTLYSGIAEEGATSYIEMMRLNAGSLVRNLR